MILRSTYFAARGASRGVSLVAALFLAGCGMQVPGLSALGLGDDEAVPAETAPAGTAPGGDMTGGDANSGGMPEAGDAGTAATVDTDLGRTGDGAQDPSSGIPEAPAFTAALAEEYSGFADRLDALGSDRTAAMRAKAERAAAGEIVQPDYPPAADLPLTRKGALDTAHARLLLQMLRGARQADPGNTAIAQASFDCWLDAEAARRANDDGAAVCRERYRTAMGELQAAVTADQPITIFFGSGSREIDTASRSTLQEIAGILETTDLVVDVVGRTDTAGSAAANQRLSERRAGAVRDALLALGVDAASIGTVEGRGEEAGMPDGRSDPQARRVDLILRR
ncbi:MAG: OmpA family protein [Azospirillaceae bacterium]